MNRITRQPNPRRLREMAKDSHDPIVRSALRDLADEYERMQSSDERVLA